MSTEANRQLQIKWSKANVGSTFSDDLVEKSMSEITIHDVDALALTLLVDFAYTGELVVCEENVQVG